MSDRDRIIMVIITILCLACIAFCSWGCAKQVAEQPRTWNLECRHGECTLTEPGTEV